MTRIYSDRRRRLRAIAALGGIAGALLFAWAIRSAGLGPVAAAVERLGGGFAVVFLLGGLRHALRAAAWRRSFDDRPPSLARAFAAYAAGDALGNVTPFGLLISEPSKIVLTRAHTSSDAAIAALAVENLVYAASVIAMLGIGTAAMLAAFALPQMLQRAAVAVLAATAAAAVLAAWAAVRRRRVASGIARRLGVDDVRVRGIEDRIFSFGRGRPLRVAVVAALEAAYQAAAVFEIWFVLRAVTGTAPSIVAAAALEYVNRTITVAFQFVPMWIGVDEAGTGLIAGALGVGTTAGVALALVRKARILAWTAIGLALWGPSLRAAAQSGAGAAVSGAAQ
jgi:lysylphosphatidylglycerol synthase-like protein